MYKWKIKLIFNSGKELECYYKGHETSSGDVMNRLFVYKDGVNRHFSGCLNIDETENILFCVEEVAVVSISVV